MKDKWDILQKRKKSCLRNIKQETIIQNDRKKKRKQTHHPEVWWQTRKEFRDFLG